MVDDADARFLESVPYGILIEFRDKMFNSTYIEENPHKFINTKWVSVEDLKVFITRREASRDPVIKRERDASPEPEISAGKANLRCVEIKPQPEDVRLYNPVRFRTVFNGNREIIELLSDTEPESPEPLMAPRVAAYGEDIEMDADPGMSSDTAVNPMDISDVESDSDDGSGFLAHLLGDSSAGVEDVEDSDTKPESDVSNEVKPTVWLDGQKSARLPGRCHKVTRECKVSTLEKLDFLPSFWPVPREKTAYWIDLTSFDASAFVDQDGKPMTVDAMIKDKDQDSWRGGTGAGDSMPKVSLFTGEEIKCRRSRLRCAGFHACEHVDPKLLDVRRHELDSESLQKVIAAQLVSRRTESDSAEKRAIIFFSVCHSCPCHARNVEGKPCDGRPTLKELKKPYMGKSYFVNCSKAESTVSHRMTAIPSDVDQSLLKRLFAGQELPEFGEPLKCSRIVSAHIGARVQKCHYPHNANGKPGKMVKHNCSARRTILIPVEPKFQQMAIVIPDTTPHNHPVLPATKASMDIKAAY